MEYRKISLKKELCDEIEKFIRKHPEYGFRSIAEFVEDAIRRRAFEMGILREDLAPRFEHFNIYPEENRVTLWDRKLKRLVDVIFGPKPPYVICEVCGRNDCEHVHFVLHIPKVVQLLRDRGWKIDPDEGRVISAPS